MSQDIYENLARITNSKIFLLIPVLLLIIFFSLIQKAVDYRTSLIVFVVLGVIVIIIAGILFYLLKKAMALEIRHTDSKTLENQSHEQLVNANTMQKLFEKNNPDLARFFEKLTEKGIMLVKDVEEELIKHNERVYFIINTGENLPPDFRIQNTNLFTKYIKRKYSENSFQLNISGVSSFIVFTQDLNSEEFTNGYYEFTESEYNSFLNTPNLIEKQEADLKKWHNEFIKEKPLTLITQPSASSLLSVIYILNEYFTKEEHERLLSNLRAALMQKIKIYDLKLSYLFDSVDLSQDIVKDFEVIEKDIVVKLFQVYGKGIEDKYFNYFLKQRDFNQKLGDVLNETNLPLFNKLKNDAGYQRLTLLISSIQGNIFGISPSTSILPP